MLFLFAAQNTLHPETHTRRTNEFVHSEIQFMGRMPFVFPGSQKLLTL
jgi:hypothetical protein